MQEQESKIKEQLEREKQERREIEMSIESMAIQVQELPSIGKGRVICSYCHHRGHRNQTSNPCKLKKCTEYTFCGLKDKHPEYFNRLNSMTQDLRKKNKDVEELENQLKTMMDFSSNNEYHFIKNLTPRLYAVDSTYKTNKPKLMRDLRIIRQFLDGRIPQVTANDPEQLKILIKKCKDNIQQLPNAPNLFDQNTTDSDVEQCIISTSSPVKSDVATKHEKMTLKRKVTPKRSEPVSSSLSSSSSDSDDHRCSRRKRRKRKHKKEERVVIRISMMKAKL